ncbi:luciferin 4-monooxygenase-like [Musca autumnalis]|uniref:luciferin 4-monooxygenase-like n=1 Tax=Musca autumnalis TaxID=221902 RepID=UPI003CF79A82
MNTLAVNYDKHNKIWSGPNIAPLHNIEHHSVGRILYGHLRTHPKNVLLIDEEDDRHVTNQEALTWGIRIALFLKSRRLRYDDVVGIAARNTTYLTSVALGCFFNCTPFHGVNPAYQEDALSHCFGITKPSIIFCDGSDYFKIKSATKLFKPDIYTISEHIEGVPSVLELLEPNPKEYFYQPEKLTLGADQTVCILCSSGTTGLPKAVTISVHKLIFENPILTSDDVIYTSTALDWLSGLAITVSNVYTCCTRVITRKPFTPEHFIEMVKKYKITNATIFPVQAVALRECALFTTENVSSIKLLGCGGGYISKQTLAQIQSILPKTFIYFGYGLTEAGAISGNIGLARGNSVGKLLPNIRLRIVDDDGKNLGPNEFGEIWVNFPFHWAGYYGNPIATQRIYDSSGWLRTGDLGYMDEDGFLFVTDRKKDILKYKGLHFWPGEIENVVRELPEVLDCCVVGVYDESSDHVPGALVVKKKGCNITAEQIVNHVKERLVEPQKQLHNGVYFVESLPHNNNGKLLKREARDIFVGLMKEKKSLDS